MSIRTAQNTLPLDKLHILCYTVNTSDTDASNIDVLIVYDDGDYNQNFNSMLIIFNDREEQK